LAGIADYAEPLLEFYEELGERLVIPSRVRIEYGFRKSLAQECGGRSIHFAHGLQLVPIRNDRMVFASITGLGTGGTAVGPSLGITVVVAPEQALYDRLKPCCLVRKSPTG
jgi:hypothetical protein